MRRGDGLGQLWVDGLQRPVDGRPQGGGPVPAVAAAAVHHVR
jgi:hypothetical protein